MDQDRDDQVRPDQDLLVHAIGAQEVAPVPVATAAVAAGMALPQPAPAHTEPRHVPPVQAVPAVAAGAQVAAFQATPNGSCSPRNVVPVAGSTM